LSGRFSCGRILHRSVGRRTLSQKLLENGQVAIHHTCLVADFFLERLQLCYRGAGFVADVFDRLPAGLSCVLLHPAIDTLEIRSVTSDWRGRVADFEVFRQSSLRDHIRDLGIHLISYRPICDAMRRRPQAGST